MYSTNKPDYEPTQKFRYGTINCEIRPEVDNDFSVSNPEPPSQNQKDQIATPKGVETKPS